MQMFTFTGNRVQYTKVYIPYFSVYYIILFKQKIKILHSFISSWLRWQNFRDDQL